MGYKNQALHGVKWIGLLKASTRIITYGKIAILARVLSPQQFGLYGIASLVLALLETLTETGINIFLIQEKQKVDKYLGTAWVISIARGITISILIALSAAPVASFFKSNDAINLILLLSIVPFIRGFINPAVVSLQKDLKFKSEFYLRLLIFSVDTLVSVALALYLRNSYSLIFGLIAGTLLEVLLTNLFIKPRPTLSFKLDLGRNIVKRGKWITLAGISNYLVEHLDDAMVGRLVNTSALGTYQMAYKISLLPLTEVVRVAGEVVFPVYVRISGDRNRLQKAFIKTATATTVIAAIFGGFLFIFADVIVSVVLGNMWLEVTPILKVLVIFGVIRSIAQAQFVFFNSLKKQNLVAASLIIELTTLAIVLIPLISRFGTIGAAYAVLFASIIQMPFVLLNSYKCCQLSS